MEHRKARIWPKVLLGALCVVLLLGVGFRLIQESAVDRELEAFQAKYRALAYPVTLEELKAAHEVPQGEENVAFLLLAALDRIDDSGVDYDYVPLRGAVPELPPPGEPLPAKIASESQYYLSINEEVLGQLHELIREPYCNFPIDWVNYPRIDLGRLVEMRNLARIFALRALLLGDAGDIDGAIDAIEDNYLLGAVEQRQPLLLPYLLGAAFGDMGTASVQTLLESATLNDEQLLHLADVVQSAKAGQDPLYPLIGEYILVEHWIEDIRDIPLIEWTVDPLSLLKDNVYTLVGLEGHDARAYRRSIDLYLELFTLPLAEALDRWKTSERLLFFSDFPMGRMRDSGTLGGESVILALARHQIYCDVISAALQVERYRLQEGALPSSLEDLVPKYLDEVPSDPYDGEVPLRFRVVGESYVVYSVGLDGVDDGGYDFEADKAMRPMKEIAFVVRRPGRKGP